MDELFLQTQRNAKSVSLIASNIKPAFGKVTTGVFLYLYRVIFWKTLSHLISRLWVHIEVTFETVVAASSLSLTGDHTWVNLVQLLLFCFSALSG